MDRMTGDIGGRLAGVLFITRESARGMEFVMRLLPPALIVSITVHSYGHAPFMPPGIITTPPPITAESTADHGLPPSPPFISTEHSRAQR